MTQERLERRSNPCDIGENAAKLDRDGQLESFGKARRSS